jgi:protein-L-isoaspartate(D-aspartate) O-methyltransferase
VEDAQRYQAERERMVHEQIRRRGLLDERLLNVFRQVPRHLFVLPDDQAHAYDDYPLPIGSGQTISQPYIVALMTSLLALQGHEKVLEIGTGSGYQAAVLSLLAKQVFSIEQIPSLAEAARRHLEQLGVENVEVRCGDGSLGLPEKAPFDGILITAAAPSIPQVLLDQLSKEGKLVAPVGAKYYQDLRVYQRAGSQFEYDSIIPVAFVPLRGAHGWQPGEWE